MKVNLKPILSGKADYIGIDYNLVIPSGTLCKEVEFPEPARVYGRVENNGGYMLLKLHCDVNYRTECARCLKELYGVFPLEIENSVLTSNGDQDNEDGFCLLTDDESIETDDAVIEELILTFPTKFLCREDCRGLCPKCGKNLNEGNCSCKEHENDPRFAILAKLLKKSK